MSMTFAQSLTQLNIVLGDTGDVTFTSDEKTRALTKAWNDQFVVKTVWDSSLTYTNTDYNYTLPATLTTLKDIYISISNSTTDFPEPISSDLWEVIDGVIQFQTNNIPTGYTLYLKGNYKIATTDTLDTVNLQEYVTANAGYETLTLLLYKKANLFLKNDVTMSELIGMKRDFKQDVKEFRLRLQREYEGS